MTDAGADAGAGAGAGGVDPARLVATLPDVLILADGDGVIRWVGSTMADSLGWRQEDLEGRPMFDLFVKAANRPLHHEALARVLRGPGVHGPLEVTVLGAEGNLVELEMMVTNALEDPTVGLLVASCRDITRREGLEEELRQREAWASSLLRGSNDLILVADRRGTIAYASPSAERLLGRDPDALAGTPVTDLVHVDDLMVAPAAGVGLDRTLGTSSGRRPVLRVSHADGSWRHLRFERTSSDRDEARSVVLTGRDITDDDGVAGLLSEQTVLLERVARGAPVADTLRAIEALGVQRMDDGELVIGFYGPDGEYRCESTEVDPELVVVLERTGIARPPANRIPGSGEAAYRHNEGWDSVIRAASGGRFSTAWVADLVSSDARIIGRITLLRHREDALTTPEVDLLGLVADLATIAVERHDLQARLAHGALHDELTGLANRRLMLLRLRDLFGHQEGRGGVLFLDLDRFKLINDSLGHEAGDQLLREVTARFSRTMRPGDLIARVGGDEFVVLCPDLDDIDEVTAVAERLTAALVEPVDLPGGRVVVSTSVGVVHVTGRAEPTEILRDADLAMYEAKQLGRNRWARFHKGLREGAIARLEVENALRDAVRHDEMRLHFQPVVRISDAVMVGVEALLRWDRPGLGLVQPSAFVPIATDTGLILPLGRWVIEQAVGAAERWPTLEVAANLSARQLADTDLVDFVRELLAKHRVRPNRLCLEVTEADLIGDSELVVDQLSRFKQLGIRLAIDDFGTGFATLDYLRRFASADILKIDGSFVAGVTDPSSHDLAIVSAAMVLADNLGFDTVAEGVETDAQREVLESLGCNLAQGYLFSPPVTAEQIDEWVHSGHRLAGLAVP